MGIFENISKSTWKFVYTQICQGYKNSSYYTTVAILKLDEDLLQKKKNILAYNLKITVLYLHYFILKA